MPGKNKGFTLVELMVLVTIIGFLVLIASPYYLRYAQESRKGACITNMKKIEGAVMLAKLAGVPSPTKTDIVGANSHLRSMPTCPNNNIPYLVLDPPECPSGDTTHVLTPD